ncbi:hypothetical protein N8568_01310 [bacterium]|nr:hypothetical protein [bacterium]MDA7629502.1 hypothetical protein [Akkermansiaceae bacterium]MDB4283272.1 hypothetical protein [Akkermansiaceae bacterium]
MSDLWFHRYTLKSSSVLNSVSERREFAGALIRIEEGFACLHPWPELGDATLEESLSGLRGGCPNPLVERVRYCAQIDGEARAEGRSLFEKMEVPLSHATLPKLDRRLLGEAIESGFSTVKLKSPDLALLRAELTHFPSLRFRIDFNGTSTSETLIEAFSLWTAEEKTRLDFLEDPIPFHEETWRELRATLGIPLANDRSVVSDSGSDFLVLKPALDDLSDFVSHPARQIVTSYMDHPLGQSFAAYEAGRFGMSEICGLQTHGLFEKDAFIEQLGPVAPQFVPAGGTGLGFDDLLEALPWKKL